MATASRYIGRFAPSPSGELHFGSLLAALASYLDARANGGRWLLRMEDLDPEREPPGAADRILQLLDRLQLHWDGEVIYQSERLDAYAFAIETLDNQGLIYPCNCNRKRIRSLGGVYDGYCRQRGHSKAAHALRLRVDERDVAITDRIQGRYAQNLLRDCGDFIVRRKDGHFAYQLAVVVDDDWQGVTDIVRGHDLLDSTPRQCWIQQKLGLAAPRYAHIPVASNEAGQKLSKQHFARPLDHEQGRESLWQALAFLGQQPPPELAQEAPGTLLRWAVEHWNIGQVPRRASITISGQQALKE